MKPNGAPVTTKPRTEPRKAMGMVRMMMPARRTELNCQTSKTTIRKPARGKLAKRCPFASSAFSNSPPISQRYPGGKSKLSIAGITSLTSCPALRWR